MEIFKVASQQMQNTLSNEVNQPVSNRAVEQAQIQKDAIAKDEAIKELSAQDKESLSEKIDDINDAMKQLDTNLRFAFNDKMSYLYVNVMRADNGDIIRTVPSKQVMRLSENLKEFVGALFDKKE